jgi:hypothetical protein
MFVRNAIRVGAITLEDCDKTVTRMLLYWAVIGGPYCIGLDAG